jgi:putative transposase
MKYRRFSHCVFLCNYHLILTTKYRKKKFPFLKKAYWGTESIWSSGYFASTVGINEKIIQNYIKNQGEEDSGQAKLELG